MQIFGNKSNILLRYDYNKPCCGKDRCNKDSAAAKGLHYGLGLKNASVAVIEYDNSTTILSGSKILKISHYHSFQFSDAGIQIWSSFQAGEDETIRFGPVEFSCEVRKVLPYSKTDKKVQQDNRFLKETEKKKIFFCTEYGCNGMLSSQLHLDQATDQQVRTT